MIYHGISRKLAAGEFVLCFIVISDIHNCFVCGWYVTCGAFCLPGAGAMSVITKRRIFRAIRDNPEGNP